MMKRLIDLLLSDIALVEITPVLTALALLKFFRLGRPVVFNQARLGLHGKPFSIFNF